MNEAGAKCLLESFFFEKLVEDLRINQFKSPWTKEQEVDGWARHLKNEALEVTYACSPDKGPIKESPSALADTAEELGDVFCNFINCADALAAAGGPSLSTIFENAAKKMRARKPWIYGNDVPMPKTATEEYDMYQVMKRKEKK